MTIAVETPTQTLAPPVFEAPTPAHGASFGPLAVGSTLSVPVAASDPDAGDTVQLGFASATTGATLDAAGTNPTTGTFEWTPVEPPGLHSFTLTATDAGGNTAAPRTITVNVVNAAPTFITPTPAAGATLTGYRGTKVTVPLAVDDPDPDLRALTVSLKNGPSGAALATTTQPGLSAVLEWTPSILGTASATVKVQDAWGAVAERTFQFSVVNRPPTFTAPTPLGGSTIDFVATGRTQFTVRASDPDPEIVRLSTLGLPAGATYTYVAAPSNPSSATFAWTPSTVGNRTVTFNTYDEQGAEATRRTITLRVLHAPTALTAQPAIARVSSKPIEITGTPGVAVYGVYFPSLRAVLKTAATAPQPNRALAGKIVKFYAGNTFICQGTTASDGQAFCQGEAAVSQVDVLMAQGYRAVFAGDTTYKTVTANGAIIQNAL